MEDQALDKRYGLVIPMRLAGIGNDHQPRKGLGIVGLLQGGAPYHVERVIAFRVNEVGGIEHPHLAEGGAAAARDGVVFALGVGHDHGAAIGKQGRDDDAEALA
jgi:hypothetical protein